MLSNILLYCQTCPLDPSTTTSLAVWDVHRNFHRQHLLSMFSANRYIHQHQKDVSRALVSKVKHQKDNFLHDRAGKSPKTTEHFHSIRDYWSTIQEKERKICVCKTRSLNNYFTQFFGRHYNSLTRIQRNDITLNQTVALRVWILEDFCATQKILMAIP